MSKTFNPISCNSGTYNNHLKFAQNFKEACKKEGKPFIKDKKSTSTLSLVLLLLKQSSNLVIYGPNMIIWSKYMMGICGPGRHKAILSTTSLALTHEASKTLVWEGELLAKQLEFVGC